ncbi:MAG: hypothetical protein H0V17_23575 [Deltaproteobacteria bacterium]|nr:hypothetical protein [Deltaproteobacteria bacterium]
MRLHLLVTAALLAAPAVARADDAAELVEEAKELLIVGACGDGTPTKVKPEAIAAHCKAMKKMQTEYKGSWQANAIAFFAEHTPKTIPKAVVYPFAGGDLASALAVFPDADEITTIALEPAGDPRALAKLSEKEVAAQLQLSAKGMDLLYRRNYSHTMDMIDFMRGAKLPTQLIFSLSALSLYGYEPTSMKYFTLADGGAIKYLSKADLNTADKLKDVGKRNMALSNVEIKFRKIGSKREQTFRHIVANLDDQHLKKSPQALDHLMKKGRVSAMTKAASFLLMFDGFNTMRKYLVDQVDWMVSDATGLSPKYGKTAGFEYETHGTFERSEMDAGAPFSPVWAAEFKAQPKRDLKFRFGYPDHKFRNHLIIMRKAGAKAATK